MRSLPTRLAILLAFIGAFATLADAAPKYPLLHAAPTSSADPQLAADMLVGVPELAASPSTTDIATEKNSAPGSSVADSRDITKLPVIAIIIDDLGNQRLPGERTVALKGPVACAIMPHTSYSTYLARQAHAAGKEIILHLPMQPMEMQRIAGPGEISLDTRRPQLHTILQTDLESVPHAVGVNNHMGSLITRHPGHMQWLMDELSQRGNLFFVDSYTTPSSVAFELAVKKGIPAARRHVFLDGEATEQHVAAQFKLLKKEAFARGFAIGIGHPYPVTLGFLERILEAPEQQEFRLVTVAYIVANYPAVYPDDFRKPEISNSDQRTTVYR